MAVFRSSASFTRPDNTTTYADGDLVANSDTAASVVPLKLSLERGGKVIAARLSKSDATTLTNDDFTVHFYGANPAPVAVGDNVALLTTSVPMADKVGEVIFGAMVGASDEAFVYKKFGVEDSVSDPIPCPGHSIFALVECNAAWVPAAEEVFTLTIYYEV